MLFRSVHPDIAAGLCGDPYKWKSRDLARRMGYMFQDPEHQFVARTVLEELLVSTKVLGLPEGTVRQRAGEILAQLRLEQLAEANPFSLSGGQKRRLSVATTLINTPRVVFLDKFCCWTPVPPVVGRPAPHGRRNGAQPS